MRVRLPRARVGLWWLMVAVGVVALAIADGLPKAEAYRHRAAVHENTAVRSGQVLFRDATRRRRQTERIAYHRAMSQKYQRASFFPWVQVAPDPPPPD